MRLKLFVWALMCLTGYFSTAQNPERCGTDRLLQQTLQNNPAAAARLEQNWTDVNNYINSNAAARSQEVIVTIPVVFHVIHSGQAVGTGANISDAQIHSQIDVLNECYRKHNADTVLIPNWFKSRAADAKIEFCLASTDPSGNPTTGITRHNLTYTPSNFDANIKPVTQWDPTHYLNIWTALPGGNILGYATFPNMGPANQDGVVIDYRHIGRAPINPFSSSDTLGKTCVHEVGHWLGLYHTFQDSCTGMTPQTCALEGDRMCDTPPEAEATYGSPSLTQNTCHEIPVDEYDMWMDYMDYVDDLGLMMFTTDQVAEMRATLNTTRLSIQNSLGCTNTAVTFNYTGKIVDASTNQGISGAKAYFHGPQDFEVTTDANGNFTVPNMYEGYYDVYGGSWGYYENFYDGHLQLGSGSSPITIPLQGHHYYDDFIMNFGWSTAQNASSGFWTRDAPIATYYQGAPCNPDQDVLDDFGVKCYMTGNGGGTALTDNVDNGSVTLRSPFFDLSSYTDPYIRYSLWYYDGSQSGNSPDDNLLIRLNNGITTITLENLTTSANTWAQHGFRVSDYITPTANMRFTIDAYDLSSGNPNIVEAGLDRFEVLESAALSVNEIDNTARLSVYPNPTTGVLNISIQGLTNTKAVLSIYNVLGDEVVNREMNIDGPQIIQQDLSNSPSGLYFVKLQTGNFEKNVKFSLAH